MQGLHMARSPRFSPAKGDLSAAESFHCSAAERQRPTAQLGASSTLWQAACKLGVCLLFLLLSAACGLRLFALYLCFVKHTLKKGAFRDM